MFTIGYSSQDITPEINNKMAAFPKGPGKPRLVTAIHDPLYIKSLFVTNGQESFCICVCDLCFWQTEDVNQMRREIAFKVANLAADNIMICCTHTHSGAENTHLFGGQENDEWLAGAKKKLICAVVESTKNVQETDIYTGQIDAPFNHNRRVQVDGKFTMVFDRSKQTDGVTDPMMSLIRFTCSNGQNFDWINWTGHALTVGPENDRITADFPGALCELIKQKYPNNTALFSNGCAGNIHPYKSMKKGFECCDEIANNLFDSYQQLASNLKNIDSAEICMASNALELHHRHDSDLAIFINMSCLTIGEYKIGFLPGEPYVEFQLKYREAMKPAKSFVNGYSNGWQGYLPTEQAFDEGGYGVDSFPDNPPEYGRTQISKGEGELILKELIQLSKSR